MDWQSIIVILIVGAATLSVGFAVVRKIRSFSKRSGCDSDCGCAAKNPGVFAQPGKTIGSFRNK